MAKLDLKLKYVNDDFGKPLSDGTYGIRTDIKTYELLVDDIPVINITVEYERFSTKKPNYACAFVSYDNNFFMRKESEYNNKGYATTALNIITEKIMNENNVPRITLNITDDNKRSLRVAEKAGYKYIKSDEYSVYNPNAEVMIEEGLAYLKEMDMELYELQIYSQLKSYQKYLEQCLPEEKTIQR